MLSFVAIIGPCRRMRTRLGIRLLVATALWPMPSASRSAEPPLFRSVPMHFAFDEAMARALDAKFVMDAAGG